MKKLNNYLLSTVLCAGFLFIVTSLQAQVGHRTFRFNAGDEYETDMLTNSNAVLKRGTQVLHINSSTTATKSYKVNTANDNGTDLTVQIKYMDNVIEALGEKLHYNSASKLDSTSTILKALDFMVKLPLSKDPITGVEYDSILVIIDRLTKYTYIVLYIESSTADDLA